MSTGGVGGDTQVVTLRKDGNDFKAEELDGPALEGHKESLNDLEDRIKEWKAQFTASPTAPAPPAPPAAPTG
jgi:hypothetical protein